MEKTQISWILETRLRCSQERAREWERLCPIPLCLQQEACKKSIPPNVLKGFDMLIDVGDAWLIARNVQAFARTKQVSFSMDVSDGALLLTLFSYALQKQENAFTAKETELIIARASDFIVWFLEDFVVVVSLASTEMFGATQQYLEAGMKVYRQGLEPEAFDKAVWRELYPKKEDFAKEVGQWIDMFLDPENRAMDLLYYQRFLEGRKDPAPLWKVPEIPDVLKKKKALYEWGDAFVEQVFS